jgi:hypothetical protein
MSLTQNGVHGSRTSPPQRQIIAHLDAHTPEVDLG